MTPVHMLTLPVYLSISSKYEMFQLVICQQNSSIKTPGNRTADKYKAVVNKTFHEGNFRTDVCVRPVLS